MRGPLNLKFANHLSKTSPKGVHASIMHPIICLYYAQIPLLSPFCDLYSVSDLDNHYYLLLLRI